MLEDVLIWICVGEFDVAHVYYQIPIPWEAFNEMHHFQNHRKLHLAYLPLHQLAI